MRPCWNCGLVRMAICHRKPFRMRNVTLTFPVAHAHTCLLETWGATDILPFKPAVALWLTLFFRIGLWIDTLVPKGLRLIKEWIFASVFVRPCCWTPANCLHWRPYLFASCTHGFDFISSTISSKIQGENLRITWSCATFSVCDYTEYGFCEIWVLERHALWVSTLLVLQAWRWRQ